MTKQQTVKRSTIGNDPFAILMPRRLPESRQDPVPVATPEPAAEPKPVEAVPPETVTPPVEAAPATVVAETNRTARPEKVAAPLPVAAEPVEGRRKLTVHLDADVVNRVKNAAYWNPRLTIARIAERGIRLALKEVEKENNGAYPQREGDLVGGRPIK
jgi:hypothetical protein